MPILCRIPALAIVAALAAPLAEPADLLVDGTFSRWSGGKPEAWVTTPGATSGSGPESELGPGAEGGVRLAGSAATGSWLLLSQQFAVNSNATYRLRFRARVRGSAREAGQFSSCYVGLAMLGRSATKPLALQVADVAASEWSDDSVVLRAPAGASAGEVRIFLSHTGALEVSSAELHLLEPAASFALLIDEMDRHYSYFAQRGIDWRARAEEHRTAFDGARDATAFAAAAIALLGELKDDHVWVTGPDGQLTPTFSAKIADNYDFRAVGALLEQPRQVGRIGFVGRTKGGCAYVNVASLQGPDDQFEALEAAIVALLDAPGLLLDLRANAGGDERRAQRIAGLLTAEPRVYAKARFRSGPGHADFGPSIERVLEPRGAAPFTRPIVCLIGPRCVSSGEGFVKMVRALPHAVLVGQNTRGASGNPAPLELPNGVTVHYSRWYDMLPDGTCVEGKGVAPDVRVEHEGSSDPTFQRGLDELTLRVAATK